MDRTDGDRVLTGRASTDSALNDRVQGDHRGVDPTELLARCHFGEPGSSLRIGVSGGADSLALLLLATAADLRVTAVHVDHGLRAGGAAEVERVRTLARRLGAGFEARRVDVAAGPNLEARARDARRSVLGPGAATGHTADDQAETVLINLLRGAGPTGLAAMTPGPTKPILGLRRAETRALCEGAGLDVFEDPSNADPRFVRNRVRNELLPLLDDIAGRDVAPLLIRTATVSRRHVEHLDGLAAALDPTDAAVLRDVHELVAATALRRWLTGARGYPPSSAELGRVFEVVRLRRQACELSGGVRVARTAGRLRLASGPPPRR